MSVSVMITGGESNSSAMKEFICNSIEDIARLPRYGIGGTIENMTDFTINYPCAIGSTALVVSDGGLLAVYILSATNKWVEL